MQLLKNKVDSRLSDVGGIRIHAFSILLVALSIAMLIFFLASTNDAKSIYNDLDKDTNGYLYAEIAASEFKETTDDLTRYSRLYAITHERSYLDLYIETMGDGQWRSDTIDTVKSYLKDDDAIKNLEDAYRFSYLSSLIEMRAIWLVAQAEGIQPQENWDALLENPLTKADKKLSAAEKSELAKELVVSKEYQAFDNDIDSCLNRCIEDMAAGRQKAQDASDKSFAAIIERQQISIVLLVVMILLFNVAVIMLVIRPIRSLVLHISSHESLPLRGASEVRYVAVAYNEMLDKNRSYNELLEHEAKHDQLTDLLNQRSFDADLNANRADAALILIDVDKFKEVNDTFGHEAGDSVLHGFGIVLNQVFGDVAQAYRIGGDEFAVIIAGADASAHDDIVERLVRAARMLRDMGTSDKRTIPVSMSCGVAFSGDANVAEQGLFKVCDDALYVVKDQGRNGYAFSGATQRIPFA